MKILNNKYELIFLLFCVFGFYSKISAQISSGGEPVSFRNANNLNRLSSVPILATSMVDRNKLIEEDKIDPEVIKPIRVATAFDVDYDFNKLASCETLPDGGKLCRLAIKSEDAIAMNIHFDQFILPEGALLYIYNKEKDHIIGAFTSKNNKTSKNLPTGFVLGEEIVIEYYQPATVTGRYSLHIDRIGHDYRGVDNFFGDDYPINNNFNSTYSCQIDVNCTEGTGWEDEKRAVAGIVYYNYDAGAYYICTGSLINNTAQDRTPYFLTASHCINTEPEAQSALFYFNYESPSCQGPDGSKVQCVSVATLRANSDLSDMSLLELTVNPPDYFNVCYAGWNRGSQAPSTETGIHHPKSDVKKISHDLQPAVSEPQFAWSNSPTYPANSHWRVEFDQGLTEGGSSGSPLFNQAHQIVGQLNGGSVGCPGYGWSVYGKLHKSWTGGDTPETSLQTWLDPLNLGVSSLNGISPTCPLEETISATYYSGENISETVETEITATNEIQSGANVVYDAGNLVSLNPGFVAQSGSVFCGLINGCISDIVDRFAFLEDIIYSPNCCDDVVLTYWYFPSQSGYEPLYYIYIENGPNCSEFTAMYLNDVYLGPNLATNFDISLGVTNHYINLEPGCVVDIFEIYPWITAFVDPNNCCANTTVTSYVLFGVEYLYVEYGPSCGGNSILYKVSEEAQWCQDNSSLDCLNFYGLDYFQGHILYESGACKTDNSDNLVGHYNELETSVKIYPNPAKGSTALDFYLPEASNVAISLYDIQGKEIKQIVNDELYQEGLNQIAIDCSGILAGTYFCTIKINDEVHNRKLIILE